MLISMPTVTASPDRDNYEMLNRNAYAYFKDKFLMLSPLFAIPLNMGTGTWVVTIIAGLSFVVMFGLASAGGDYKGLINTTLENDALARERRKAKK